MMADDGPQSGQALTDARAAGYSWDDINDHVARASAEAASEGYTQDQIDAHLGYAPVQPFADRARAAWTSTMAADPQHLQDLSSPEPQLDLTASPTVAGDYSRALLDGNVKGPRDFADQYAASALDAAHGPHMLDSSDPDAVRSRQQAASTAADALLPQLPTRADLTDAALFLDRGEEGSGSEGSFFTPAQVLAKNQPYAKEGNYITALSPGDEEKFRAWAAKEEVRVDPPDMQTSDYDLRGFWKGMQAGDPEAKFGIDPNDGTKHEPDKWKTPYDLTFSAESQWAKEGAPTWNDQDQLVLPNGTVVFDDRNRKSYLGGPDVQRNLMDHWEDTGQKPVQAALAAQNDPSLRDKLTAPPPEPPQTKQPGIIDDLLGYAERSIGGLGRILTEGPELLDQIVKDYVPSGELLKGQLEAQAPPEAGESGYDRANRLAHMIVGNIAPELPRPRMLADLGAAIEKMPVNVIDPGAEAGQAITKSTVGEAFATPKPAAPKFTLSEGTLYEEPGLGEEDEPIGYFHHAILDEQGQPIAHIEVQKDQDIAHIDTIFSDSGKNAYGPRGMREIARQYFGQNPEIQKIEGNRVSGARAGSGSEGYVTVTRDQVMGPGKQFAEDAAPAEKMQALARDSGPHDGDPNYFQNLAKDQDPATQELARGQDAAAGVTGWFRDLLRDESGTLRIFKTINQKQETTDFAAANDFAKQKIIEQRSLGEQQIEGWASNLAPVRKLVDRNMADYEREVNKGPAGNWRKTTIGNLEMYMGGRSYGAALTHDSPLAPVADGIRDMNMEAEQQIRAAVADGVYTHEGYWEDYNRQQWQDPNKADQVYREVGRQGSGSALRHRSLTFEEGMDKGLTPAVLDPIDRNLRGASGTIMYTRFARVLKDAEDAGHVYWDTQPRAGAAGTPDMAIKGVMGQRTRKYVDANGQAEAINEYRYANPGFAKPFNDAVANGLYARPAAADFYDMLQHTANAMRSVSLALPIYHFASMAKETIFGGIANGLTELAHGEIGRGLADVGMSATLVPKLAQLTWKGGKANTAYRAIANDPALQALVEAGARFGPRQEIYKTGAAPSLYETFGRGGFNPFNGEWDLAGGMRRLGQEVKGDFNSIWGDPKTQSPGDRALMAGPRFAGFIASEINRFGLQTINAPVFDKFIPAVKSGTNMERMNTFLRHNLTAAPDVIAAKATEIARNSDHRMGELNQDNLFWPRMVKQAANLAMLSSSWVYGTMQMLMRGVGVNPEMFVKGQSVFKWNPTATTALVGAVMGEAIYNSTYQFAMTGKLPGETDTPIKDLFVPRTGGMHGNVPERALLPGQVKELFDLAKVAMTAAVNPGQGMPALMQYASGKLTPLWHLGMGLLSGEDAVGKRIYYEPGVKHLLGMPIPTPFLQRQLQPIFSSQLEQRRQGSAIPEWQNIAGIKEAPEYAENPSLFISKQLGLAARWTKEAISRARREAAQTGSPPPSGGGMVITGGGVRNPGSRFNSTTGTVTPRATKSPYGKFDPKTGQMVR